MGRIHIYTGDGKGKTTAAVGLAVRAAGAGKQVRMVLFLKGGPTGERASLAKLGIAVARCSRPYGFWNTLAEGERAALTAEQNQLLAAAAANVRENRFDLIVLDELIGAYRLGAVEKALADGLLLGGPYETELVVTGRQAPASWIARADYVTEMICRKHPYERGLAARKGIEY